MLGWTLSPEFEPWYSLLCVSVSVPITNSSSFNFVFVSLIWCSYNTYKLAFDGYFLHPPCCSTLQSVWGQTCWHENSYAFWYSKWCVYWISQLESWFQFNWILSGLLVDPIFKTYVFIMHFELLVWWNGFNVSFVDDETRNHTVHSYARNYFLKEAIQVNKIFEETEAKHDHDLA